MKKIILAILISITIGFGVFAQGVSGTNSDIYDAETFEAEKTTTQIIIPSEQHTVDQTATVKIEYMPMYDEARIYYETLYVTFDKGEAMNTVMACMQKFVKDNKYYNYKYMQDDRVKYFRDDRGQRRAMYSSHIKLIR